MTISNMPGYIEITGTHLHETDDAVMFDFGVDRNVWIPKSCMEDWPDRGEAGTVLMEEWMAIEKEIV